MTRVVMGEQSVTLRFSCDSSLLRSVKDADVITPTVVKNTSNKPTRAFVKGDATVTTGIVDVQFLVFKILLAGRRSQIEKPVLFSVAVDVIHILLGPLASNVEPREAVLKINATHDLEYAISVRAIVTTCALTRDNMPPAINHPCEQPGHWIVGQQFF